MNGPLGFPSHIFQFGMLEIFRFKMMRKDGAPKNDRERFHSTPLQPPTHGCVAVASLRSKSVHHLPDFCLIYLPPENVHRIFLIPQYSLRMALLAPLNDGDLRFHKLDLENRISQHLFSTCRCQVEQREAQDVENNLI